jgi:serine/threonine-protein kinase
VLPFANMSTNPEDEYFGDGMAEEIINALTQVAGLRVAARTSSFMFKGKSHDLRAVGEKLNVGTVLEGSVRRAGNRVRITAQLVNVTDGYHLWSERYDRELVDVFALQDEIANAIAGKLQLSLLTLPDREGREGREGRAGPRNLRAYELLLEGRVLLWQRGRAILDALPCFEQAVVLDPMLTEAHALLGDAHRLKWIYGIAPAKDTIPRAREALDRALAIDPGNAQALSTLANLAAGYDNDIEAAVQLSDRVLARDPSNVQALCEKALVVSLRSDQSPQRYAQALQHLRAARAVDPLNAWAAALHSWSLACVGLYDAAVEEARHAVVLDPHAFTGRWALVGMLSELRRDDEAMAVALETLPMSGRNPRILADMVAIHVRRGETSAARAILDELRTRASTGFVESSVLGAVTATMGLMDEACTLVARGIAEREPYWQWAKCPAWASFRADPEGAAILSAVGYGPGGSSNA